MANQPISLNHFPGLRLDVDPTELGFDGALDLENIDYTQPGTPRLRPGTRVWTHAPGSTDQYESLYRFDYNGIEYVFAARYGSGGTIWDAIYDTTRAVQDSSTPDGDLTLTAGGVRAVAYGVDDDDPAVFASTGLWAQGVLERFYIGTGTWNTPTYTGNQPSGACVAVTPWDNRLVNGGGMDGAFEHTLLFSDEGDPETFPADNTLTLHPGDGERITDIVTWGNRMFVFKNSKFYVFWGTSNLNGTPVFEYDTQYGEGVSKNGGRAVAVMRDGVYFANHNGVFRTNGGPAQKISGPVQALWEITGNDASPWNPYLDLTNMNLSSSSSIRSLTASGDLLMLGTLGARVLVHNVVEGWWSIWELPRVGSGEGVTGALGYDGGFLYCSSSGDAEIMQIYQHSDSSEWSVAAASTYLDNAANEVQSVVCTGGTAGNFRLTWNGQTTGDIAYNADAGTVQSALVALSNIASGDVYCNGGPLPDSPVTIEFLGTLAFANQAAITIGNENVTNGNAAVTQERTGTAGDTISAYWISGASNLGEDTEKVVRDVLVTATGGTVKVAISTELGAFPTPNEATFTDTETLRIRGDAVNVAGRTLALKILNDTSSETTSALTIHRVTLSVRGRRPHGIGADR